SVGIAGHEIRGVTSEHYIAAVRRNVRRKAVAISRIAIRVDREAGDGACLPGHARCGILGGHPPGPHHVLTTCLSPAAAPLISTARSNYSRASCWLSCSWASMPKTQKVGLMGNGKAARWPGPSQ